MGTGIYKIVKGGRVELSTREVKKYVMKVNNWTSDEYNKKYDIFKNKLRAFENFQRAHGVIKDRQSPMQLLYKEAKAKVRDGADYTPSIKMQRIKNFTSVSSGKAGQRALQSSRYMQKRNKLYEDATNEQFRGFIKKNAKAQEIANAIEDPVKREEALRDYADAINAKIDEQDEVSENETIPMSSEVIGSTDEIEFDYSKYL